MRLCEQVLTTKGNNVNEKDAAEVKSRFMIVH